MKDITDNMNDILGIEGELVIDDKIPPSVPVVCETQDKDVQTDYEFARSNLYAVIEKGAYALDGLLDLAKASEHPRAYEVVSQLTKTLVEANKDLLEVQKKVKDLKQEAVDEGKQVTNNNLYVGSTAELLKLIKGDE